MRLIDADAFKAYMRGALEQTRRCYPDGGEWAEAVTEEFCRDIDEQPTVQPVNMDETPVKNASNSTSLGSGEGKLDLISRRAAIDALTHEWDGMVTSAFDVIKSLLSAQPEIIRCKDCIYYDPPHVENNGVRYEYTEMPADAFDVLGTGLVTTEYGINIGGRCCRDYNAGYEDDKRVYVPENNHCGRGERRTDG